MKLYANGLWVVVLCIALQSCSEIFVPESSSNRNTEDIETAWAHIDSIYPLFDFKQIDWDSLQVVYRQRAELSSGDEIYTVLFDLIAELRDGHAKIFTAGGESITPHVSARSLRDEKAFDPNLTRRYFDKPLWITGNHAIEYEFVSNDIGYVRISTFGNALKGNVNDFDVVIDYFSAASGLIIDIRNNGGGSSSVYDPIIGRLIDSPIETESAFTVMGTRPSYVLAPLGPRQYTRPTVILINGTSFSGAEVFADRMRQLDHVTLAGDTTAGGGMSSNGNPRHFLPSGKSIAINYEAILRKDGQPIEWNGVPPDIRVSQTETDIEAGKDKQLEFAIEFLR